MLKKAGQEKWLPILELSVETSDRLCDSVGKDREKSSVSNCETAIIVAGTASASSR